VAKAKDFSMELWFMGKGGSRFCFLRVTVLLQQTVVDVKSISHNMANPGWGRNSQILVIGRQRIRVVAARKTSKNAA
jgi:hypothetical protein